MIQPGGYVYQLVLAQEAPKHVPLCRTLKKEITNQQTFLI